MPAASRSQSSHAQPCSYASGARNSDASATRPVITMSAPSASASAIGRAPRYAAANTGGRRHRRRTGRRCRDGRTPAPSSVCSVSSRREHVVAEHCRDLDAGDPHRPRGLGGGARGRGRVDPARVGDDLGAAVGDVRERAGEIRGKVARVAARLVALAVLLQDRERQLGQRLEAEVVDALGEQRVDRGRCVAVETLSAGDDRDHDVRRAPAAGGRPTARGSSWDATRSSRSSRPYGAPSTCEPIGRPCSFHDSGQRDRGRAGHVGERRVRHERARRA